MPDRTRGSHSQSRRAPVCEPAQCAIRCQARAKMTIGGPTAATTGSLVGPSTKSLAGANSPCQPRKWQRAASGVRAFECRDESRISADCDAWIVIDQRIGAIFRTVRVRRGLRQQDVADRAGVSRSVVSDVERGHLQAVTLASLRRIAAALEIWLDLIAEWHGGCVTREAQGHVGELRTSMRIQSGSRHAIGTCAPVTSLRLRWLHRPHKCRLGQVAPRPSRPLTSRLLTERGRIRPRRPIRVA